MIRLRNYVWALPALLLCITAACQFSSRAVVPGECGPACADIRAAASANFSSDAAKSLRKIAAREGMAAHEQLHLIDAAVHSVSFSSDLAGVLATLAANKTLRPSARRELSHRIEAVSFSSDRKRIADALVGNPDRGDHPEEKAPQ